MAGSGIEAYAFETLAVQRDATVPGLLEVALNRPRELNTFNGTLWRELRRCMEAASMDPDTRCVLLHGGSCRLFTAGLDLKSEMSGSSASLAGVTKAGGDASRRALKLEAFIDVAQQGISSIERCRKPVLVAMHAGVIGAGVDLATACDVRLCSEDAFFSVAEVNIGLAADVGTLQRLPRVVGNDSLVRELAFTGRRLPAAEAKEAGLVSRVLPSQAECLDAARELGREIASKSPVAVLGTKVSLNYSRDHSVQEGLEHVKLWNSIHLQSNDLATSVQATLTKSAPKYSKL